MEEQLLTHILVYYNVNKTIDKALDQPISINCSACVLNVNLSDHNLALLVKWSFKNFACMHREGIEHYVKQRLLWHSKRLNDSQLPINPKIQTKYAIVINRMKTKWSLYVLPNLTAASPLVSFTSWVSFSSSASFPFSSFSCPLSCSISYFCKSIIAFASVTALFNSAIASLCFSVAWLLSDILFCSSAIVLFRDPIYSVCVIIVLLCSSNLSFYAWVLAVNSEIVCFCSSTSLFNAAT